MKKEKHKREEASLRTIRTMLMKDINSVHFQQANQPGLHGQANSPAKLVSSQPSVAAIPDRSLFSVALQDRASVNVVGSRHNPVKYVLHHVLTPKPGEKGAHYGHSVPFRDRNIGILAVRLNLPGNTIFGNPIDTFCTVRWISVFKRLGVFEDARQRLGLAPVRHPKRLSARMVLCPHHYRHTWLCSHWAMLRMQEQNPGFPILVLSLAEIVAAAEAGTLPTPRPNHAIWF